jgi:hypothetical protein
VVALSVPVTAVGGGTALLALGAAVHLLHRRRAAAGND